jgi:hypothetical protein
MATSATVRILVRNLGSDTSRLQFSNFSIEELRQGNLAQLQNTRKYFPEATYGEWILERYYASIPPVSEDWSGLGAIPFEIEDLLLLLRLYRPGNNRHQDMLSPISTHLIASISSARHPGFELVKAYPGADFREHCRLDRLVLVHGNHLGVHQNVLDLVG